jgi:hypothetical protein
MSASTAAYNIPRQQYPSCIEGFLIKNLSTIRSFKLIIENVKHCVYREI